MKCDIQILGIVSLKAATRADEMAMTALTIHAQGRNEEREVTATGMLLGAWPKLYSIYKEKICAPSSTRRTAHPRTSTPPPEPYYWRYLHFLVNSYSLFSLHGQSAPGLFVRQFG